MKPLRILVVDDDREVCEYLETVLAQQGQLVYWLQDPTQAIREVRRDRYHVVCLDLVMPGLSGLELLARIREIDSDLAVILLTGCPSMDSVTRSIGLEVSAYLTKPVTAEELRHTLQSVARKKGLLRSQPEFLHQTIGQTIRQLRRERKQTLKQLARQTELSASLLSQIERAQSSASIATLFKVSTALGIKIHDLFGEF
jgi:DNA-binding response OmpR family regulator